MSPDVVGLAGGQGRHEALELAAELGADGVELERRAATGGRRLLRFLCAQSPAANGTYLQPTCGVGLSRLSQQDLCSIGRTAAVCMQWPVCCNQVVEPLLPHGCLGQGCSELWDKRVSARSGTQCILARARCTPLKPEAASMAMARTALSLLKAREAAGSST